MNELLVYLKALSLTILFELIAAIIIFKIKNIKDLLVIVLVNIITNPLLVYFSLILMYYLSIETGRIITYLLLEPLVIICEYLLFKKFLNIKLNYLSLAIVLNIISIIGGIICQRII